MSKNRKDIDQLFKQKLKNFTIPSEGASWDLLQSRKKINLGLKKALYTKIALGAVVIGSSVALFIFSDKSVGEEKRIELEPTMEEVITNDDVSKEETTLPAVEVTKIPIKTSPALPAVKNEKLHNNSKANHLDGATEFEWFIKDDKYELNSEASTSVVYVRDVKAALRNSRKEETKATYDEYAPVVSSNGSYMFFTSRKPITNKEIRQGRGKERIYYTETDTSGWTEAQLLPATINSEKHFNSAVSLSRDGKRLFLYRDNRYGNGDLYVSKLKDSKWSAPEKLPSPINSMSNESSLSLSADGNTLFFTSDREGGYGGMDIWFTQKNKAGTWGEAKNLGGLINTESDEDGVFIHPDGKTLYFSSRGHGGMGGYDIFYTTLENGEWTKPINLGPEINTEHDDIYFVLDEEGTDAYFTSTDSLGVKEIFKVKYNHDFHQKSAGNRHTLLQGTVLAKPNHVPIEAEVVIYEKENNKIVSAVTSNAETGSFAISIPNDKDYRMHVYKKGYLYYTEEIIVDSIQGSQIIQQNISLDRLRNNTQFILLDSISYRSLNPEITSKLDELHQLATLNPELKFRLLLEISTSEESDVNGYQQVLNDCIYFLENKASDVTGISGRVVFHPKESPKNSYRLRVDITSLR